MSWPNFIIYQEKGLFKASYLETPGDVEVFAFRDRNYRFAGQCPFYHHLTDSENRLIGFVLQDIDEVTKAAGWGDWLDAGENKFGDLHTFYFCLAWPHAVKWEHDGSCMIAANIYCNDKAQFLITISDTKATGKDGQFQNLWSSIGFPLAPADQFQVIKCFPENL